MIAVTGQAQSVASKTKIFISYSRKDMTFVDRLEPALKARGFEPLIDRSDIYAFENWWKRIEALIGRADTIVFVLSPEAVKSDVALKEVVYAASLNKRFAPIVCEQVEDAAIPEALRELNFVFFDDQAQFETNVDALAEALRTDIGWIRRHTEFGEAARRWEESARPGGLLLRPPILDQAEAWITFRPDGATPPTSVTQIFITESRKAELATKRRNRALRGGLYAAFIGVILGLVGWINQARIYAQWRWWAVTIPYAKAQIRPYVLSLGREQALKPGDSFKECASNCPLMIVVPAGSFIMGSPPSEVGHKPREEPEHNVTIAKPFAVSQFVLTFADWDACATYGDCDAHISDGGWGHGLNPVVDVSWDDAKLYVSWFSRMTGKSYRLLPEAEYEYVARAGIETAYPWGDEIGKNNANCNGCGSNWDNRQTAPVGSFAPNRFNLYDVVGNSWEWVEDCMHDNYEGAPADGPSWSDGGNCSNHVARSGSWSNTPDFARLASRVPRASDVRNSNLGFRVGRT